jgi:hypothetical protein
MVYEIALPEMTEKICTFHYNNMCEVYSLLYSMELWPEDERLKTKS